VGTYAQPLRPGGSARPTSSLGSPRGPRSPALYRRPQQQRLDDPSHTSAGLAKQGGEVCFRDLRDVPTFSDRFEPQEHPGLLFEAEDRQGRLISGSLSTSTSVSLAPRFVIKKRESSRERSVTMSRVTCAPPPTINVLPQTAPVSRRP
jgi:hypothetical protein